MPKNNYSIDVGDAESESTTDWGIVITQELVDAFHKKDYYLMFELLIPVHVWLFKGKSIIGS